MLKMAEISSGRSLNPNIPREPKLGYVLRLQRLKKTSGNAVGGKGLINQNITQGEVAASSKTHH